MFFDILTLFPGMFTGPFSESIIARARKRGILDINLIDIRDYTTDKHRTADDAPYGGGAGMIMKPEPIFRAWQDVYNNRGLERLIFFSPQGKRLDQKLVKELSQEEGLVMLCGHYEGIDQRIRSSIVTDEISIGDYVLTGGELPAMVLVDAVARMIPGVLGDKQSKIDDSFYKGLLDYPHFTRPRKYREMTVPDILLSGNHGAIERWRYKQALKRTLIRRPDLLEKRELNELELELLREIKKEIGDGR